MRYFSNNAQIHFYLVFTLPHKEEKQIQHFHPSLKARMSAFGIYLPLYDMMSHGYFNKYRPSTDIPQSLGHLLCWHLYPATLSISLVQWGRYYHKSWEPWKQTSLITLRDSKIGKPEMRSLRKENENISSGSKHRHSWNFSNYKSFYVISIRSERKKRLSMFTLVQHYLFCPCRAFLDLYRKLSISHKSRIAFEWSYFLRKHFPFINNFFLLYEVEVYLFWFSTLPRARKGRKL